MDILSSHAVATRAARCDLPLYFLAASDEQHELRLFASTQFVPNLSKWFSVSSCLSLFLVVP